MIHEYAVEPEVAAAWSANRKDQRHFLGEFGVGTPRIVSKCPRRWTKLVWAARSQLQHTGDVDKKRAEVFIDRLSQTMVKRRASSGWSDRRSWLENVVEEHRRTPFRAILAQHGTKDDSTILGADGLDDDAPLWATPRGVSVPRTAGDIADAVRDMLRAATDVVFIDPHFKPQLPRYVNVIAACLRACREQRIPAGDPRIRILSSAKDSSTPEYFAEQCRARLPGQLPLGQQVVIRRLRERSGQEKLHNRYILTELGGVSLGVGLDEGQDGATDDLVLLDRGVYYERWKQYASDPPAFDLLEEAVEVTGAKRA